MESALDQRVKYRSRCIDLRKGLYVVVMRMAFDLRYQALDERFKLVVRQ